MCIRDRHKVAPRYEHAVELDSVRSGVAALFVEVQDQDGDKQEEMCIRDRHTSAH